MTRLSLVTTAITISAIILTISLVSKYFSYFSLYGGITNRRVFYASHNFDPAAIVTLLINQTSSFRSTAAKPFSWANLDHRSSGILFLKTHKTSSSTVSRLIVRNLCEIRGKKCFLPNYENPGKIWDFRKEKDLRYARLKAPYDVWASHVMTPQVLRTFVVPKTLFISICRRPSSRFRSAWSWYGHGKVLKTSLAGFTRELNHTGKVSSSFEQSFRFRTGLDSVSKEIVGVEGGRLSMTGPFKGHHTDSDSFKEALKSILTSKYLVLVSDRFDESLLILGQFLHWEVSDLMYMRQKVTPPDALEPLTDAEAEILDRAQPHDTALFTAANFMLDFYISQYRGGVAVFESDLTALKLYLSRLDSLCAKKMVQNDSSLILSIDKSYPLEASGLGLGLGLWNVTVGDVKLYCDSLRRDNDEWVRHEWDQLKKSNKTHPIALLKKIDIAYL